MIKISEDITIATNLKTRLTQALYFIQTLSKKLRFTEVKELA